MATKNNTLNAAQNSSVPRTETGNIKLSAAPTLCRWDDRGAVDKQAEWERQIKEAGGEILQEARAQ